MEHNLVEKITVRAIVKDIIIFIIGLLILWAALLIIFGTQNPFYVVSSESMVPELQVFDILVVNANEPFEEVQVGDVIVFHRPTGQDRVIVHRVASIINEDPFTIRAKGDANPASIPGTDFPITQEEYIGQVIYVIPQVGYVTRIITPPINYIIIAVIIGLAAANYYVKRKKSDSEQKDEPEQHPKKLDDTSKHDSKIKDTSKKFTKKPDKEPGTEKG